MLDGPCYFLCFWVFFTLHPCTVRYVPAMNFSCQLSTSSIYPNVHEKKKRQWKNWRGFNPFPSCRGFQISLDFQWMCLLWTFEFFRHYWSSCPKIFAHPPKFRKKSELFKYGFENILRQTSEDVDRFKI